MGGSELRRSVGRRSLPADLALARTGEIRRLFVRHEGRGTGLGRRLAEHLVSRPGGIELAPRLNTLPAMVEAQALYSSMGIEPCAPYVDEALDGVLSFHFRSGCQVCLTANGIRAHASVRFSNTATGGCSS